MLCIGLLQISHQSGKTIASGKPLFPVQTTLRGD